MSERTPDVNDPELSAMQSIAEAVLSLNPADQKRIARWSMPTTTVEVKAQGAVLAALEPLNEPQRQRVIRWTVSRFTGPASAKAGRPKKAQDHVRSADAA
jgi:hypothetical protein